MKTCLKAALLIGLAAVLSATRSYAGDWPQWRYDAARSATTPDELPDELHLQWVRRLPAPRPAWPASQPSLRFDVSYSPVAAEKLLFVPSMVTDTVTAYDTETGGQRWQFFTDGPVRLAPAYDDGKLYFGSDDGYLYCVDAVGGELLWKFRGGPSDRKIIGNERLISTWPVRGGPVVSRGVVYFTAGIWPFMGIFVHAVDTATGASVWTNSGDSITYQTNPHGSPAFGGLIPRGHLAVTEAGLVAPGGRTPPGTYDLETGKLISFNFSHKGGRSEHRTLPITAGSRTFMPAEGAVICDGWEGKIDGTPWNMLAADDRLFVVTVEGKIYCFGAKPGTPVAHAEGRSAKTPPPPSPAWMRYARGILKVSKADAGYGLVLGIGSGNLAEALARSSSLHVVVIDTDESKIDAFRREMIRSGLYGPRLAAHVGDPVTYPLPPYLASMVTSEDLGSAAHGNTVGFIENVFDALRPYGGTVCLQVAAESLADPVEEARLTGAAMWSASSSWTLLVREGALPDAADWTHNYADAGNSLVSKDELVKAPLGLLWFGGPSNDDVLPRHGHGPSPQVAAGRLFIEGANMLRALDIYTGRLLWQRRLPGIGTFYDHTNHQPGAGEIGSNYVSLPDSVYAVYGNAILRLDAATGETIQETRLEPTADNPKPNWGGIAAWDDLLIATSTPTTIAAGPKWTAEITPPLPTGSTGNLDPLIPRNDTWQYLAGTDPTGEWTEIGYDARLWKVGPAGFGYGDDDDRTRIDMKGKSARVYIRKTFAGAAAGKATEMSLAINYDDAFIAYLNGREIARANVLKGTGAKASGLKRHEARKYERFPIEDFRELLHSGENVIAVEGHNVSIDSSDFSLDPYVLIKTATGKAIAEPEPVTLRGPALPPSLDSFFVPAKYSSASRSLVVMDRNTGERLWQRDAVYGFRHNNIALGAGKLFCIDGLSTAKRNALKRRGIDDSRYEPILTALDVRTGEEIWSTGKDVFGTFLNYSTEHDVLLQAGSSHRDRATDESDTGMVAYRGADGEVIWKDLGQSYSGPCMLHKDTVIAQPSKAMAWSLLTGEPKTRVNPLTGTQLPWQFTRNYGCNTAVAGQNLITFRSAAAGFYDLENDGGTGNLGGFKSGCTSNMIIAGGLLNVPEYTRTCTCNYQNQTSLALIHDPRAEMWTFNAFAWDGKPVRRLGINFGAPGDRLAKSGTLWLDCPSIGGPSPDVPVAVEGTNLDYFRHHASRIAADEGTLDWVAGSGVEGVAAVTVTLADDERARRYTIRLHFADPQNNRPGERIFSVALQGKEVLADFDVAGEAGGVNRAIVRELHGVVVSGTLSVSFIRAKGRPILSGIEVLAE